MKKLNFQKKTVVLLVVIAVILASLSLAMRATDSGETVQTQTAGSSEDASGGEVGVTILPPEGVEDLGDGGSNES